MDPDSFTALLGAEEIDWTGFSFQSGFAGFPEQASEAQLPSVAQKVVADQPPAQPFKEQHQASGVTSVAVNAKTAGPDSPSVQATSLTKEPVANPGSQSRGTLHPPAKPLKMDAGQEDASAGLKHSPTQLQPGADSCLNTSRALPIEEPGVAQSEGGQAGAPGEATVPEKSCPSQVEVAGTIARNTGNLLAGQTLEAAGNSTGQERGGQTSMAGTGLNTTARPGIPPNLLMGGLSGAMQARPPIIGGGHAQLVVLPQNNVAASDWIAQLGQQQQINSFRPLSVSQAVVQASSKV